MRHASAGLAHHPGGFRTLQEKDLYHSSPSGLWPQATIDQAHHQTYYHRDQCGTPTPAGQGFEIRAGVGESHPGCHARPYLCCLHHVCNKTCYTPERASPLCLVSGPSREAQKVFRSGWGRAWGATLTQAFIGENSGSHLILFLPLPGGSWRGRSRVVSLLLSLSSLALSRSSTSFWSCRSSLFIWVLM